MKAIFVVTTLILTAGCAHSTPRAETSPPTTQPAPEPNNPIVGPPPGHNIFQQATDAELAAVKARGARTAAQDINAREFRILVYGGGGPKVDPETGYLTQSIPCCDYTGISSAEADAYNHTMRDWHARHR